MNWETNWETIIKLSDGNIGALNIVLEIDQMKDSEKRYFLMDTLLSYGIVGSKLYMLYADCCGKDFDKFVKNVIILKSGAFDREFVLQNLGLVRAKPMIDDEILKDKVVSSCIEKFDEKGSAERLKKRLTTKEFDNRKLRKHLESLKKEIEKSINEEGPSGFGS